MRLDRDAGKLPRWLRWLAIVSGAFLLLWLGGLARFVADIPLRSDPASQVADGIVVLTGGPARIAAGLALLKAKKGKRMLISGVHPGTSKAMIAALVKPSDGLIACCTDLGFTATDTRGNAVETAEWAAMEGYHSLYVVTATYHMPRALLEMQRHMPRVKLYPYPVFPKPFGLTTPWAFGHVLPPIVVEYEKYIAALISDRFDAWSGFDLGHWLYSFWGEL